MIAFSFRLYTKLPKISSIKTISNESCRYKLSNKNSIFLAKNSLSNKKPCHLNIKMAFPKETTKRTSIGSGIFAGCCFSLCKKRKTDDDEEKESHSSPTERTKLLSSLSPKKPQDNLEIGAEDLSKSFDASGAYQNLTGSVSVASNIKQTIKQSNILSVKADIVPESSKFEGQITPESAKDTSDDEPKTKKPKPIQDAGLEQKKKRKPPNYFLALQISNPEIIEGLKKVQDNILKGEPKLQPALVSLKKLHITLLVFNAEDDEELQKAKETLQETETKIRNITENSINLNICEVSSFKQQVVFAGIKDDGEKKKLLDLYEILVSSFESKGFGVKEGRPFNPHLTLFKLSQAPKLAKKGIRKIEPHLYKEHCNTQFGLESIKSIQLLSMNKPKDDNGYYCCVSELNFDTT